MTLQASNHKSKNTTQHKSKQDSKQDSKQTKRGQIASLPQLADQLETGVARAILLKWYDKNKRELPWRGIDDPWATWVSEIMLQQTRVSSVLEYFDRFMTRFPTPASLATAEWDEVASLWAGLGYYRRAKNLWRGAQDVVEHHGGEVPSDMNAVRDLTGVGPYTAGAILSIAFNQPAPLVDGNVARVFSRLYRVDLEMQTSAAQKIFWGLAAEWVDGERPGDFNQALMELGATVCRPKSPTCLICPLRVHCRATQESDPMIYPVKKKKTKTLPREEYIALIIEPPHRDSRHDEDESRYEYLVMQRSGDGLLSGLWGLPSVRRVNTAGQTPKADEISEACYQWVTHLSPEHKQYLRSYIYQESRDQSERDVKTELASPEEAALHLKIGLSSDAPIEVTHRFTHKLWCWWVVRATLKVDPLEEDSAQGKNTLKLNISQTSAHQSPITFARPLLLDQMALGGPSLKGLRAAGIPLKARRGSGR